MMARARQRNRKRQIAAITAAAAALHYATAQAQRTGLPMLPSAPTLNFAQGTAPGLPPNVMAFAAYSPADKTIYAPGRMDGVSRAHEAGHAFDDQVLTSADRLRLEQIMGVGKGRWNQGTGLEGGLNSPNEYFADFYSAAANHVDPRHEYESAYVPQKLLTRKRLKAFEKYMAQLGKQRSLQAYSAK